MGTEEDTFRILSRKSVMETYHEWISNPIEYYTREGHQWFVERGWNGGQEWYDEYKKLHPDIID